MKVSYFIFLLLGFFVGCSNNSPSNLDVINALIKKEPLAIAGCLEYREFERINGYKDGDLYIVDYKVVASALKSVQECSDIIRRVQEEKPEMALLVLSYLLENLFSFAWLDVEKEKQLKGRIEMIKSEAGWIEKN